ncbi:hypothetical protein [Sphingomonas bacterium]|uniref:hypothetical protein n=1 Tax=Sphingomonas bacterium TaxID=1895847 RepID=UPI00261A8051|nr:hypothetical protein [Sphingomonas bacterium]
MIAALMVAPPLTAQVAGPGVEAPKANAGTGEVARGAAINGVLTLYGNQRCPTDTNGNEVVVCVRRSAAEQYRVPKELREFEVTPENASWAAKAQGTLAAGEGVNAIGSCSVVGPGGQSGCFLQSARANRAENKQRAVEANRAP